MAHFSGVQLCGAIHVCPVCSPRIRQERAKDVDAAALAWLTEHGAGSVLFLTLTMPHDYGEKLKRLLKTIGASFGAMISGKAWQLDKARFGIRYYIVSYDVTVGKAGWHPHLHVVLFGDRRLEDADITTLGDRLHKRWARAVERRGHRPPNRENGLVLERARDRNDVARYVCQVVAGDDERPVPIAMEVTRGDLKTTHAPGQRTPWQLLADISDRRAHTGDWTPADDHDDDRDRALWREWETATKGVRAIRWARNLRTEVGLSTEETSDEEIVKEKIGGTVVYQFQANDAWRAIVATFGARAHILRAAERLGPIAVRVAIDEIYQAWRRRRARLGIIDSAAGLPEMAACSQDHDP